MNTQLSAEVFDELVKRSNFQEDGAAMARAVLVDGRGYADVALEYGRTRQAVYQAATRALALVEKPQPEVFEYHGSPEEFKRVDAIVDAHKGRKMLTIEQFQALLPQSRLAPHNAELAYGVLVDGLTNIELAKTHGIARHLPWQAASRLMKYFDPTTTSIRVYKGSAEMFAEIDALSDSPPKGKRK